MDDVLGSGGLDEGDSVELALETDEPTKICCGGWVEGDGASVLGGKGVEEPGDEDTGTGGKLGGVEELTEETLELLDRDGRGGDVKYYHNRLAFNNLLSR